MITSMTTTAMMIAKSPSSLAHSDTSAATRMMYTSGLLTCERRMAQGDTGFSSGSRFSPNCRRRASTSEAVNPCSRSVCVDSTGAIASITAPQTNSFANTPEQRPWRAKAASRDDPRPARGGPCAAVMGPCCVMLRPCGFPQGRVHPAPTRCGGCAATPESTLADVAHALPE